MEAQEHRLTPLLLLLATIFFAGAPSSGAARGEAASSGLHPVVLLPGFTCSQFDARLTDEYEPPQASGCGARRQVRGWFRLWENYTALQADPALLPCYQDQLRLVYDPAAGNYRNDPGVETRVVSFGTTRSFRFDDPAQKDACMVRLVEALEGVGYREGASLFGAPLRLPLRAGGARRGVPLEADAPRGTRERELGGDNFIKWKTEIGFILLAMDKNLSLRLPARVAPVSQETEDTTLTARTAAYEKEKERRAHSDRVALSLMNMTINPSIRGALDKEPKNAKNFMNKIESYFQRSDKANASTLLSQLVKTKYNGQGSVREHIMGMVNMRDKLQNLDCPLNDTALLHTS